MIIRSRGLRVRRGLVTVALTCPPANGLCEGRVNLALPGTTSQRRRVCNLASKAFEIRGGRSGNVTLRLGKPALRRLGRGKRVRISVFQRDVAGNASTAGKTVLLRTR